MCRVPRRPQGGGYNFVAGGDGFGGNGSGGGTGGVGVGPGGDGFFGMEPSFKNRFYCSGLP
jgi:hypothetical protein